MKKNSYSILLIVMLPIILVGLALFIFKDSLLTTLRQESGVDASARVAIITATTAKVASSTVLDTGILKLPLFVSLVNQVNNFDFDNICWRPNAVTSQVISAGVVIEAGLEATSTESTATANCVPGNSQPFKVKK